ncbi:hypothetical protein M3182_03010 [Mesobacillus maritimus]|uniref:hypothetical protein n=1 Tax=Mesobacillus maritimus TaxID=1643336 RepID=UPI00203C194C|nr:hypothetical protein [Mesobacillus maritimus]MCM3584714.1 hypothetical protein [Mesobacillus maritimus]
MFDIIPKIGYMEFACPLKLLAASMRINQVTSSHLKRANTKKPISDKAKETFYENPKLVKTGMPVEVDCNNNGVTIKMMKNNKYSGRDNWICRPSAVNSTSLIWTFFAFLIDDFNIKKTIFNL